MLAWVLAIIGYTLFRTSRPISYATSDRTTLQIVLESGFVGLGAVSTGFWESPVAFSLFPAVAVAGFVSGFGLGLRIAVASGLAISLPLLLSSDTVPEHARLSAQWVVMLVLVALVAGYARRISGDADERHSAALDQLGQLTDANELLTTLHRVAQDLPASLDLDEVLESTTRRLGELVRFDAAVILLREETDDTWTVARSHGARTSTAYTPATEPRVLRETVRRQGSLQVPDLETVGGGIAPRSHSGVYVSLRARGTLVGVIGLEHADAHHFTSRDAELLRGVAEPVALAIDNARWFSRLRTVGADEERTRIARDLHDRIGQSLAYVAFELDRIVRKADKPGDAGDVRSDLDGLRQDVRDVVKEVRDTLYDLRTDVSDDKTVPQVLTEFLGRIEERTGMAVSLRVDETERMPRTQERELWRIAQEAIVNVERHARARSLTVIWRSDISGASIEVIDDGIGFPEGRAGRLDSYGVIGMRERAASIGAKLEIRPRRPVGTQVRASLARG